ncbi:Phosphatidylinositol transfer protein sfh5 [Fusarium falciforme]|uniref:Phosphatidylinositol transfer protein SFH5 n=1 Tax=Fusarium falciforme TaxID=195108 RepID=A0A9W8QWA7_9HYPO|nr:Phosphatidylinositol transfer protein sfh5 [Fusarium falciforme]KAJ4179360.1 Phosphatidylinositol transfer protein sfh5 [Fusarium falciforme]KAJ4244672.1 Phosphatidylinositol transfer protein sfh5 [Fusarium falciforme]
MAAEQDKTTAAPPAETPAAPAGTEAPAEGHAEAPAKAADEKPGEAGPSAPETPLTKLNARLDDIFNKISHKEMWGVQLSNIDHVPTKVVLQKFLRANNDDVAAAEKQLTNALTWRKNMNPAALVTKTFNKKKFDDLGFVTVHKNESGKETIITWNIYGAVKDNKATFGDVQEFIKWRAAIMELSVQKLKLDQVTEPIPEGGEDPYQMIQVHDYQNVSFFRMDPAVKAASKETIAIFSMAYPELLAHKYFVNVPAIMGWMFGAMKLFLAPATLRKFHPMTSGTTLATELKDIVSTLPKEYGGQGPSVKEGLKISLAQEGEAPTKAPVTETPAAEAAPVAEPATATESTPAAEPAPAPVEAAKEETAEKAAESAGEKPVEESLEKLTLKPVEEAPKTDKETAPAAETEKKEVTPAVESEKKEPVPVSEAEKKETAA